MNSSDLAVKSLMATVVQVAENRLVNHPSVFELFSVDFAVDAALNVKITEIGQSPAISNINEPIRRTHTDLLRNMINIEYALLYNGDLNSIVQDSKFEWVIDKRSYFS